MWFNMNFEYQNMNNYHDHAQYLLDIVWYSIALVMFKMPSWSTLDHIFLVCTAMHKPPRAVAWRGRFRSGIGCNSEYLGMGCTQFGFLWTKNAKAPCLGVQLSAKLDKNDQMRPLKIQDWDWHVQSMRVDYSGTMTNTRRRHDPTFDVKVLCWPDPQCFSRFRVASDNCFRAWTAYYPWPEFQQKLPETTIFSWFVPTSSSEGTIPSNLIKFTAVTSEVVLFRSSYQQCYRLLWWWWQWQWRLLEFLTQFFVKHHWGCFLVIIHWRLWLNHHFFKNHRHRLIVLNNNLLSVMVRWAMIYLLVIIMTNCS
jgi:hypothetical protein